jgi:hypothetical protein
MIPMLQSIQAEFLHGESLALHCPGATDVRERHTHVEAKHGGTSVGLSPSKSRRFGILAASGDMRLARPGNVGL